MPRIGRMLLRGIVLQIDSRQPLLLVRKQQPAGVLERSARLIQDAIEPSAAYRIGIELMHIVTPRQAPGPARIAGRRAGFGYQIEVVRSLAEIVEIITMHVPCQHAQAAWLPLGCIGSGRKW